MQLTLGVLLSVLSAAVSAAVAVYAHRREVPGSRGVVFFSAATAVWAGGNAVQVAATTLDVKLLAVTVQYVGILAVPLAWFVFAAEYTGRESWVTRRTMTALGAVPVVLFVAVLTNDVHHLARTGADLETVDGVVRLTREFGPLFWVAVAYSWLVSSIGTVLLVGHGVRVGSEYRRQTVAIIAGAAVPWIAQLSYLSGATVIEPEAFFGITAAAFGYAILHHDLLDLVPVARDRVFEELQDGVLVVDGSGRIADNNAAAESLLGVDITPGDRAATVLPAAMLEATTDEDSDLVRIDGDGSPRWVSVDATPVSGAGVGELVVLRDVTELQRQREELDRENDRLERVADTISHDLRNPLNVADGYLELAEKTGDAAAFERVREALERMDNIIEGTLRLARADLHAPEKTDVELAAVAANAWANVPGDRASLALDCRNATVHADPDQLESLLENVFRNAIEHGGSNVTVTVELIGTAPNYPGFAVSDDGPGIPAADRDAVFERGFTTNDDGTGLGLAIVSDIVNALDWQLRLSESDSGGVRLEITDVVVEAEQAAEV